MEEQQKPENMSEVPPQTTPEVAPRGTQGGTKVVKPSKVSPPSQLPAPAIPAPKAAPQVERIEENETEELKKDKDYIDKAEEIIDKYEDKPHEEEEQAEDLQVKFLKEKFNKDLKKETE